MAGRGIRRKSVHKGRRPVSSTLWQALMAIVIAEMAPATVAGIAAVVPPTLSSSSSCSVGSQCADCALAFVCCTARTGAQTYQGSVPRRICLTFCSPSGVVTCVLWAGLLHSAQGRT
jgi:hypothetical protein